MIRKVGDPDTYAPAWNGRTGVLYFWDRLGYIACDRHAPSRLSDTWRRDGWALMGPAAVEHSRRVLGESQICGRCRDDENMQRAAWGDR